MSKYTTGELAKLCNVSVRTVQYYDSRNVLNPTELSEGGRRLYSEDDLRKMRIICFLREAGLSINSINDLFSESEPEKLISLLLFEQEREIKEEIIQIRKKLEIVEAIKQETKETEKFSIEAIGDIAYSMKQRNKLKNLYSKLTLFALPMIILEAVALVLYIAFDWWLLFTIYLLASIPFAILISIYYYKRVAYICPNCHEVFKPTFKEMFFAYHTPRMRKLTCPKCNSKGFCVEVYHDNEEKDDEYASN